MATKKFAYIKREWKNGRWQYTYPDDIKAKRNVLTGKLKSKGYDSLDTHKHAMKQIERDVEKNSSSRNIPGKEPSGGKQLSGDQLAAARRAGRQATQSKRDALVESHARSLEAEERRSRLKNNSRNIPAEKSFDEKLQESNPNFRSVTKQTTKKQIRQGIRRAKVKTLKQNAAKAINRAKSYLADLFD